MESGQESRPSSESADTSIKVDVFLPSGRRETVAVPKSGTIAELKMAAQQPFRQRFLRLAAPDGRLLDPTDSPPLSGLQHGDSLAAARSAEACSAHMWHMPCFCCHFEFWPMELQWHGAIDTLVVTVPESKISLCTSRRMSGQKKQVLPANLYFFLVHHLLLFMTFSDCQGDYLTLPLSNWELIFQVLYDAVCMDMGHLSSHWVQNCWTFGPMVREKVILRLFQRLAMTIHKFTAGQTVLTERGEHTSIRQHRVFLQSLGMFTHQSLTYTLFYNLLGFNWRTMFWCFASLYWNISLTSQISLFWQHGDVKAGSVRTQGGKKDPVEHPTGW